MLLSVVAYVYQSAPVIREFHREMKAAAADIYANFEIVFVNDDSRDDSLEVARELVAKDDCVRVIDLSRTFGYDKAILTGLAHAGGDVLLTVDCRSPQNPEWFVLFDHEMKTSGADSVYAAKAPAAYRLMNRAFVTALLELGDREVNLRGLYKFTGYKQVPIVSSLPVGGTAFGDWMASFRALAAFNTLPLVFIFQMGSIVLISSLGAALGLVVDRLFFRAFLPGWPSLIVSIWLLGGLILFCLGVVALYLSKVFQETKDRPDTIVREVIRPGPQGTKARV